MKTHKAGVLVKAFKYTRFFSLDEKIKQELDDDVLLLVVNQIGMSTYAKSDNQAAWCVVIHPMYGIGEVMSECVEFIQEL